ncbi:hypothetical protein E2C01_038305 [Portunus trituberculatus]|uniref:Uncharacterized protein n=1 Tax=Portunus trituberculatus TaxID=210409 RepID=A0A5B7FI71_PORTR|nr:hypothetical protein [Portunus trituberculatus]
MFENIPTPTSPSHRLTRRDEGRPGDGFEGWRLAVWGWAGCKVEEAVWAVWEQVWARSQD